MSDVLEKEADLAALTRRIAAHAQAGAAQRDQAHELPYSIFSEIGHSGYLAVRVPREHGGADARYEAICDSLIEIARADPNVAQVLIPHFTTVERVRICNDVEARARIFRTVVEGALYGVANAEKRKGDGARTTLLPDGDVYRLNGEKFYCTGGLFARYLRVTAEGENGRPVVVLIPAGREGVAQYDDWDGMGQRLTASGSAVFTNVVVQPGDLLPPLDIPAGTRDYIEACVLLLHAAIEVGIGLAILEDAIAWGNGPGAPFAHDDAVVQVVGEISTQVNAARAFLRHAARAVDDVIAVYENFPNWGNAEQIGRQLSDVVVTVSEAKIHASRIAIAVASQIYEIGGASLTGRAANLDRHWRNARTHTTHDSLGRRTRAVGDYRLNGVVPPRHAS